MKSREIFNDRLFWAAVICGPVVWCALYLVGLPLLSLERLQGEYFALMMVVAVYPVLEEIVFRGGLQAWLGRYFTQKPWYGLSLANILASCVFTAMHFIYHPPMWAASVFVPSLVFGYFWDRHQSLLSPIALHMFYNAGFALLFMGF